MFVWDESKRRKVIENHKVDFALLTDVFDDPYGVYRDDAEHSDDEEIRYFVIGATAEYGLIFAIFIYVDNAVRLITARRAEQWMVKEYEKGF